jgi:hypothetical protein
MLVSDLEKNELTQLAGIVSLPLARRLAVATSDRTETVVRLFAQPVQKLAEHSDRRLDLTSLLGERLPTR